MESRDVRKRARKMYDSMKAQYRKMILNLQPYCKKRHILLWYYAPSRLLFIIPWNAKVYQESITGNILCLVMIDVIRIFAQVEESLRNNLAKAAENQECLAAPEKGIWTELSYVIWIFTHDQSNQIAARWNQFWNNYDFILNTLASGIKSKGSVLFIWSLRTLCLCKDKQMHVFIREYTMWVWLICPIITNKTEG